MPSNLVHAIAKDSVLQRFHTKLGITATVIGDDLAILDHDLARYQGRHVAQIAGRLSAPVKLA
ncbi:hypothetical protein [Bosea sp. ASV33]|uniref:hypothetical protein n=1 Tax=Bosea sp. ASV33 TaxID=2795106 RepID=UPI0018EC01BD|nr:hypothetical protein [Bosea sp. ASV33]